MPKLIFNASDELDHAASAQEIVDRLAGLGYEISLADAHQAWKANSESMSAGWLILPEDDQILLMDIQRYCIEV